MTKTFLIWLDKHGLTKTFIWFSYAILFALVISFALDLRDEKQALETRLKAIEQKLEAITPPS